MEPSSNIFRYVESEKSTKLHNSKGSAKSRIHVIKSNHLINRGEDRYAVAAEALKFEAGQEIKLGRWDRLFSMLVQDDGGTWYKVNKQSFIKRFNPKEELQIDENGYCKNFSKLVDEQRRAYLQLEEKTRFSDRLHVPPFEREFLHQLSKTSDASPYQKIYFFKSEVHAFNLTKAEGPYPSLIIYYDKKAKFDPQFYH